MKYRKKPVVIEAFQLHADTPVSEYPEWLDGALRKPRGEVGAVWFPHTRDGFAVGTLEDPMFGNWGNFIIQGVQGELYPCKPDIFEQTYEVVTSRCRNCGNPESGWVIYSPSVGCGFIDPYLPWHENELRVMPCFDCNREQFERWRAVWNKAHAKTVPCSTNSTGGG